MTRLISRKGRTPIGLFIAAKAVVEELINKSQQLYRRCVYRKAAGALCKLPILTQNSRNYLSSQDSLWKRIISKNFIILIKIAYILCNNNLRVIIIKQCYNTILTWVEILLLFLISIFSHLWIVENFDRFNLYKIWASNLYLKYAIQ